jgi:DNA-binding MarR family transcriptional regulator
MKKEVFDIFSAAPLGELPLSARVIWLYIFQNKEITESQREIAAKLKITAKTVTSSLKALEQNRLIAYKDRITTNTPTIKALEPDGAVSMF